MCVAGGVIQKPLADLIACIDTSLPDEGLDRLRDESENCPACMLAALVQCGAHKPGFLLMTKGAALMWIGNSNIPLFDFKAECKSWWEEFNNEKAEADGYY